MIITRQKNTKNKGTIEFFVYPEKGKYIGVCLTFDIVEEGKDPQQLMGSLLEAARLHLKVVRDKNLSGNLLNRYAPVEYWKKYFAYLQHTAKEHIMREKWQAVYNKLLYTKSKGFDNKDDECLVG
ncbi:MAG: hypothetical protein G01um101429_716 [Parcubacteria group bacterium Gr01-1014_29]|nr:MAG: hypothetical protein G01um101429_716 [Parcubacteria group bacterium Gr01-1014_29]